MSFSHFAVKRHAASVSNSRLSDTGWNPFSDIEWGHLLRRPNTWGGPERRGDDGENNVDEGGLDPFHRHGENRHDPLRISLDELNFSRPFYFTRQEGSPVFVVEPDSEVSSPRLPRHSTISQHSSRPRPPTPPEGNILPRPLGNTREKKGKQDRRSRFYKHVEPKKPFTAANQIQRIFLSSKMRAILFPVVPVGFALNYTRPHSVEVFVLNLIAAIPLLAMNDEALVEISLRLGSRAGGLIYIFTANLVQLVSCVLLISSHQGSLVQVTIAGGILANLLFILGLALISGGVFRRPYQFFHLPVAHVSSNLLSLAATSLLIPTASRLLSQTTSENLSRQSRGASFILILVYVLYLFYQLSTHRDEYNRRGKRVPMRSMNMGPDPAVTSRAVRRGFSAPGYMVSGYFLDENERSRLRRMYRISPTKLRAEEEMGQSLGAVPEEPQGKDDHDKDPNHTFNNDTKNNCEQYEQDDECDEDAKNPQLHFAVAVLVFASTTVLLYFCIDFVVSSINSLTETANISHTFVGLILLPLPNCDFSAITLAREDRLDEAMTFTIGKCLQTALFVTPLTVLIAWGAGVEHVTLVFEGFEVVSIFTAVLLLNLLMADGKTSWIQGILLLADWGLIAIAAFYATQST